MKITGFKVIGIIQILRIGIPQGPFQVILNGKEGFRPFPKFKTLEKVLSGYRFVKPLHYLWQSLRHKFHSALQNWP